MTVQELEAIPSLNLYSKDEWRDVVREIRPDWSEEQFEAAWEEFWAEKSRGSNQ